MAGPIPAMALAVADAPPADTAAAQDEAQVLAAAPACFVTQLPTLAEWLRDGPFTLALASSFFGFYHHAGALQALAEAGIAPACVSGSSSGAIVASLYAGGLDPCSTLPDLLLGLRRQDILTPFWRFGGGRGGIFRINQAYIAAHAPITHLEQAQRCGVAISTYDVFARRTVVHRAGPLAQVVAASCAIPIFMQPVLLAGRLHVDGFVEDLLALESCDAEDRVLSVNLHFRGALRNSERANKALLGARATPQGGREMIGCRHGVRPHTTLLQLHGLPLVGPTSMQAAGAKALAAGRDAMRAALQERRQWGGQRIHAVKPAPRVIM